jgi:hypothetical protein
MTKLEYPRFAPLDLSVRGVNWTHWGNYAFWSLAKRCSSPNSGRLSAAFFENWFGTISPANNGVWWMHQVGLWVRMAEDRTAQRSKLREKLAKLKSTALAELERRGYEVRGKRPAEIRQILKRRSLKQTSKAQDAKQGSAAPTAGRPTNSAGE